MAYEKFSWGHLKQVCLHIFGDRPAIAGVLMKSFRPVLFFIIANVDESVIFIASYFPWRTRFNMGASIQGLDYIEK